MDSGPPASRQVPLHHGGASRRRLLAVLGESDLVPGKDWSRGLDSGPGRSRSNETRRGARHTHVFPPSCQTSRNAKRFGGGVEPGARARLEVAGRCAGANIGIWGRGGGGCQQGTGEKDMPGPGDYNSQRLVSFVPYLGAQARLRTPHRFPRPLMRGRPLARLPLQRIAAPWWTRGWRSPLPGRGDQ